MNGYDGNERREYTECAIHEEKINNMMDTLKEIKVLLKGNGKIGLCGKVNILWGSTLFMAITVGGLLIKTIWANLA